MGKKFRPMTEHPEAGTRVTIKVNDLLRDGIWDGKNWLHRKPYTKNEFEPLPEGVKLEGWDYLEREPYEK